MKQQTLKPVEPSTETISQPQIDPLEKRNEVLESIVEDCVLESETYVSQSKAPEGE